MKKRIAAVLITAMISGALWGCSSGSAQQGQEAQAETAQEEAAQADAAQTQEDTAQEEAAQADPAQEAAGEVTDEGVRPSIMLIQRSLMDTEDLVLVASGNYEKVQLTEEACIAYPSLNKFLTAESDAFDQRYEEYFEEVEDASEIAREQRREDTEVVPVGSLEGKIEPVRCDEEVLSFFESVYTFYPDAAHGFTFYNGYNYDTASGNPITLEDVFKDPSALQPVVEENLRLQSLEQEELEVGEELKSYFGEGQGSLVWAIDEQGVTFLFAPSAIAPYALGTLEAKISFAQYPDLFTGKYGPSKDGYIRKLSDYVPFAADLDGDGSREMLSVNGVSAEEDDLFEFSAIKVQVGDTEYTKEMSFFNLESYLIHTEDGKNYIYAVTTSESDYHVLSVFEIDGKEISEVGTMEETAIASVFHPVLDEDDGEHDWDESFSEKYQIVDPASFALDTTMKLMSTYGACRYYEVGSDGMPSPITDYYQIIAEVTLTSRVPLTAEAVDPETGKETGEQKELPAGTKCRLWRTNGEDTVDVMLEDGSAVRFNVEGTWPQTVNGVDLEEAFEGTVFGP